MSVSRDDWQPTGYTFATQPSGGAGLSSYSSPDVDVSGILADDSLAQSAFLPTIPGLGAVSGALSPDADAGAPTLPNLPTAAPTSPAASNAAQPTQPGWLDATLNRAQVGLQQAGRAAIASQIPGHGLLFEVRDGEFKPTKTGIVVGGGLAAFIIWQVLGK